MPSYQRHPEAFDNRLPLAPFVQHANLPLGELLTAADIQQALDQHQVRFGRTTAAVFTPAILMWTWLWQCLSKARSCGAAVMRTSVLLLALRLPVWSEDTGVYCRARAKLPAAFLRQLGLTVGQRVEAAAAPEWLWRQRHVYLLDGSTATLADTPENQKAYPQSGRQQPGLGFPLLRFVLLLGLATATVELAFGPHKGKETGETALARQIVNQLRRGEVVVADRYYCSYWLVALLLAMGVDVVFRLHQKRGYDFQRGRRLGQEDHVVQWQRPARPEWMSVEEYASVPETLEVRELCVQAQIKGFGTKSLVLVTTLLHATEFAKEDIGDLFRQRWQAELDLRSLKQTLGMDQLRCTAPELIERDLWMHVLAYNLIRKVMAQAALWAKTQRRTHQRRRPGSTVVAKEWTPREFSFTCAVEQVMTWWHENTTGAAEAQQLCYEGLLSRVSRKRVGQRPNRLEPRALKRRPKEYDRLLEPRAQARARLLEEWTKTDTGKSSGKARTGKSSGRARTGQQGEAGTASAGRGQGTRGRPRKNKPTSKTQGQP